MTTRNLRNDIMSIGAANFIAYALQFLLPVVVARALPPDDFAGYRMVWLVIGTLMSFATLQVPQSLSYFLPRVAKESRGPYILGAVLILSILGMISAALVNPWFPLLPIEWVQISGPTWFYSVFVFMWVIASLVDWLPVGDGQATWQAGVIITLSVTRVLSITIVAWLTGSLVVILQTLIAFVVFKLSLLVFYILRFHNIQLEFPLRAISEQVKYTWSFGLASGLYSLRRQAELWLVAALFAAKDFASFSLGGLMWPVFGLIRTSVSNVAFPKLSFLNANKDKDGFADLNRKATSTIAFILIPFAVFLWVLSDEVMSLLFTRRYIVASDIMRIYLFGVIPQVFESSILLRVVSGGRVALKIDLMMLPLVVLVSFAGVKIFGLQGGAIGSVAALFVGHFWAIWSGVRRLGIPIADLYDFQQLGWIFCGGVLAGLAGFISFSFFKLPYDILTIISGGCLMSTCYIVFMIAFKRIPEALINVLRRQ